MLQAKKDHVMIDLGYLGEFRDVALYVNDRQINRVGYSEEAAERTSYVVRVNICCQLTTEFNHLLPAQS